MTRFQNYSVHKCLNLGCHRTIYKTKKILSRQHESASGFKYFVEDALVLFLEVSSGDIEVTSEVIAL